MIKKDIRGFLPPTPSVDKACDPCTMYRAGLVEVWDHTHLHYIIFKCSYDATDSHLIWQSDSQRVKSFLFSQFVAVRGIAKKQKDQNALIRGGLEDEDAGMTQRRWDGRNNMQARIAESGNGKLDHEFLFSIHFDLRDCTVSISCYLGYLQRKMREQSLYVVVVKQTSQIQHWIFHLVDQNCIRCLWDLF